MKVKLFSNLLFIFLALCLTSCFQVIEEINLNNDGSGEVTVTLNLSNSKTRLASIMLLDSINGYKVPDEREIEKALNDAVAYLQKSEGISNVTKTLDLNNFIASISFSFQNISNINHLSGEILKQQKVKYSNPSTYSFLPSEGLFIRKYQPVENAKGQYLKLKEEDKSVFKQAAYTNILRFKKDISKFTNTKAQVSKSNKAIMLKCSVEDLITGKFNISNQITLSNK